MELNLQTLSFPVFSCETRLGLTKVWTLTRLKRLGLSWNRGTVYKPLCGGFRMEPKPQFCDGRMMQRYRFHQINHVSMFLLRTATAIFGLLVANSAIGQLAGDDVAPLPEDPATVMAVVGQTPILWGDIQPKVDSKINQALSQMKQQFPQEQLAEARLQLSRAALRAAIQTKVMRECFLLEQVGTQSAEKRREVSATMNMRARQIFFENELQNLKEKFGTEDLNEIDAKLRETGTSLQARQRESTDMMLGHMYMKSKVDQDPEITIAEINNYYAKHINDYRHGAKARWEQLSVLFENHPTRKAAMEKLMAMGREVYNWELKFPQGTNGVGEGSDPLAEARTGIKYNKSWQQTARDASEEPYAADGGQHDWTTQGALASTELDQQIFSMPLMKFSEIIEDKQGLHIIRVRERKAAGVLSLADVQDDIRAALKKEKIAKSQAEMVEQMQKRVPVWSIYPDDFPGAKPLRPTVASRERSWR